MQNIFKKVCLFFGVLAVSFALAYGVIVGVAFSEKLILISILSSLTGTLFFWLILKILALKTERSIKLLKVDLHEEEYIISEGPANYYKNVKAVEGKLFLTTDRLIFMSHKLNNQNYQSSYVLKDILSVELSKTWGLFNSGLKITFVGNVEKFAVDYSGDWNSLIEEQMILSYL